jgi:hypothetical protein
MAVKRGPDFFEWHVMAIASIALSLILSLSAFWSLEIRRLRICFDGRFSQRTITPLQGVVLSTTG